MRSASAEICCTDEAISTTRADMSSTDAPMRSNAVRVWSTVATPSSVRFAPSATTSTTLPVSRWISAISPEISNLISEMQAETGKVVEIVADGAKRTEDGVATVERTREAFEAIGRAVEDMSARVAEIASTTTQISAEAERAEAEVGEVASVAEESSASAEQVSASTQQTSASTQEIAASAQSLAVTAEQLDTLVRRFKVTA